MASLDAIRQNLLDKREELLSRVEGFDKDRRHGNEPVSPDFAEQATEREGDDVLDALSDAARRELRLIQRALERIDNGTYTECAVCGDEIPLRRLEALPYSDRCVQCAEKQESARPR